MQLAVFGLYMGASFAPNHKGMPIIPADVKLDFFTKQVRTSRNISGGWWATALMGGLNYQIEHHLFPSMPRPHLRAGACAWSASTAAATTFLTSKPACCLRTESSSITSTVSGSPHGTRSTARSPANCAPADR